MDEPTINAMLESYFKKQLKYFFKPQSKTYLFFLEHFDDHPIFDTPEYNLCCEAFENNVKKGMQCVKTKLCVFLDLTIQLIVQRTF